MKRKKIDESVCQVVIINPAGQPSVFMAEVTHLPTGLIGKSKSTGYLRAKIMAFHDLEEKLK